MLSSRRLVSGTGPFSINFFFVMGVYRLPACHRLWLGPERTESLGDLNATGASESALHICLLPKRRGALLTRSGG
ncbi:hypothetical protein LINPERHAP1_LOCUS17871 [Linum perenne]